MVFNGKKLIRTVKKINFKFVRVFNEKIKQ